MRAHSDKREKMGWGVRGRAKIEGSSPSLCPWCGPQLLTARRLAPPGPRGAEAADGTAATSGPCLTLFAARPGVPLPVRRLLRSEGQRASRAAQPALCPAVRHRPPILRTACSPRSLRLALPQAESTDPNPNAAPLISKAPVPRFPGTGAELLRPQRQSLRLTSPGGGGAGAQLRRGGGGSARAGETWRRGRPRRRLRGRRGSWG